MKCHYCGRPATKINTMETRTGSGTTVNREYVCKVHASLRSGRYDHAPVAGLIEMGHDTGNYRAKTSLG
jgi:hypothetical protein